MKSNLTRLLQPGLFSNTGEPESENSSAFSVYPRV